MYGEWSQHQGFEWSHSWKQAKGESKEKVDSHVGGGLNGQRCHTYMSACLQRTEGGGRSVCLGRQAFYRIVEALREVSHIKLFYLQWSRWVDCNVVFYFVVHHSVIWVLKQMRINLWTFKVPTIFLEIRWIRLYFLSYFDANDFNVKTLYDQVHSFTNWIIFADRWFIATSLYRN